MPTTQSSAFQRCFDVHTMQGEWTFLNDADCRAWLFFTAAYALTTLIFGVVFLLLVPLCCACPRVCQCVVCRRGASLGERDEKRSRIGLAVCTVIILACLFVVCGFCFAGLSSSRALVERSQSTVDNLLTKNIDAAQAILALNSNTSSVFANNSYIVAAAGGSGGVATNSFMSASLVADANKVTSQVSSARETARDIWRVFTDFFGGAEGETTPAFGGPAIALWFSCLCVVSVLLLAVILLCPCVGDACRSRNAVGIATGVFCLSIFLLVTPVISVSATATAIVSDVCRNYDEVFLPAIVFAGETRDVCHRRQLATAARDAGNKFSRFLLETGNVQPNLCGDVKRLCFWFNKNSSNNDDCNNIQGCISSNPFPTGSIDHGNTTFPNISSTAAGWWPAIPQNTAMINDCATSSAGGRCPDESEEFRAAVRIVEFQRSIFSNLTAVIRIAQDDYGCAGLKRDLGLVKQPMCEQFFGVILAFAVSGAVLIVASFAFLVFTRWLFEFTSREDESVKAKHFSAVQHYYEHDLYGDDGLGQPLSSSPNVHAM